MNLARLKYLADQIQVEIAGVAAKSDPLPPAVVFPHLFNGHLFRDQVELDAYNAAVAVRDANLARYDEAEAANYVGSVDPASMTLYDWSFFFQHKLERHVYSIFSRKPVYQDNQTGVLFTPGYVATQLMTGDVSAYPANGGVLARFV